MKQWYGRIFAWLSRLQARYDMVSNHHKGLVSLVVVLVFVGTFFAIRPVYASCGFDIPCYVKSGLLEVAQIMMSLLNTAIVVILEALIPVMLYNEFSTAPVVTSGWAMVRDTVNMFFVIILIVIAFGTIFGHKKFQWAQQVPKLLLFAIVINFSKTLCGIMIDFGQVVMLTFANALREIATGNIIELFGLNKVSQMAQTRAGAPTAEWDMILASILGVMVLAWVLVIMLMLFAILVYRIVALWILIVVAPLTWFVGGTGDLLKSNAYADWWAKFKCFVAIGPVITFFLWLALAVAGAGNTVQGFNTGAVELGSSAKVLTEIFEIRQFLGMVIGSAILMAGMQQAQSLCNIGGASPLGIGKRALQLSAGTGLKVGGWGGRKIGGGLSMVGRGTRNLAGKFARSRPPESKLRYFTTEERARRADEASKRARGGFFGRKNALRLERKRDKLLGVHPVAIAKAGEKYSSDSSTTRAGQLARFAKKGAGGDSALALFKEALGDENMMKELEASGAIPNLVKHYGSKMDAAFKGDSATTDKLKKFKKRHAALTGSAGLIEKEDDVKNLSEESLADENVQNKLKSITVRVGTGKKTRNVNAMKAVLEGKYGDAKKQVAEGGYNKFSDDQIDKVGATAIANAKSDVVQRAVDSAFTKQDLARVDEISKALMDQYKHKDTSGERRFEISDILNKIGATISSQAQAVQTALPNLRGKDKAERIKYGRKIRSLNKTFGIDRRAVEQGKGVLDGKGNSVGPKFGTVLPIADQEDHLAFINQHFANASDERRDDARSQMGQQYSKATAEANAQYDALIAARTAKTGVLNQEGTDLDQKIVDLRTKLDTTRKGLMNKAKEDAQALKPQIANKEWEISAKERDFSTKASRGAPVQDRTNLRNEIQALQEAKDTLEQEAKSKLSSVDLDPAVTKLEQEINESKAVLAQTLINKDKVNVNTDPELKQLSDAYTKAQGDTVKILQALAYLDALPKARPHV